MSNLNKVTLIGRLGSDPQVTISESTNMAKFSVAISENTKTREHTEWVDVVLFGKLVAVAESYLHKGSLVYLEGRLRKNSYEDKEGIKRYSTNVIVDKILFLDTKRDKLGSSQPKESSPYFKDSPASGDNPAWYGQDANMPQKVNVSDSYEDDLPF